MTNGVGILTFDKSTSSLSDVQQRQAEALIDGATKATISQDAQNYYLDIVW